MRLVIDSLIVVMVLGVIGGVLYLNRQEEQGEQETAIVIDALGRLYEQTKHHAAIDTAIAGRDTIVVQVMPSWFQDDLPLNVLVGEGQPWIDLAPPGDASVHPPDPIVTGPDQAGFWYNPTAGVFRARVLPQLSERETLDLYNRINGTALDAFEEAPDPARAPLAYTPGVTPTTSYASPAAEWVQTAGTAELSRPNGVITPHVDAPENVETDTIEVDPILIHDLDEPDTTQPDFESDTEMPGIEEVETPETEPEPAPRPTLNRSNPAHDD
ncbi:MAG: hypothetical protein AAGA29_04830 [Planctomycetota bacterium]